MTTQNLTVAILVGMWQILSNTKSAVIRALTVSGSPSSRTLSFLRAFDPYLDAPAIVAIQQHAVCHTSLSSPVVCIKGHAPRLNPLIIVWQLTIMNGDPGHWREPYSGLYNLMGNDDYHIESGDIGYDTMYYTRLSASSTKDGFLQPTVSAYDLRSVTAITEPHRWAAIFFTPLLSGTFLMIRTLYTCPLGICQLTNANNLINNFISTPN